MQPSQPLYFTAGTTSNIVLNDWQKHYAFYGNHPTIEVWERIDFEGETPDRLVSDALVLFYKSNNLLTRVRIIYGDTVLNKDLTVIIK